MKKLMVLGAGVMQVPLIRKAKEMDLWVIVVGSKGNYPGLKYASQVEFIDFNDSESVVELAQREHIDGVWTCGLDMPVRTMSIVSERLGLPGIPALAGEIVSDKWKMKDCFASGGVRTARYRICHNIDEAEQSFGELRKPVMFKAIDGQGSKGIVKVSKPEQISYAFDCVRKASHQNAFIVEEFISGIEIGAQAFVLNGEVKFIMPHGDYVFHGDTGVPIGHYVPSEFSDSVVADCKEQLVRCVKAANLQTCAINADFILSDDEIYVLEIGARCGATMLAETVSLYYGFDYYEKMIQAALGENVDFTPGSERYATATMTLMSKTDGVIVRQENSNRDDDSDIVMIQFDHEIGDRVHKFKLGIDRLGHVIVRGKTLAAAQNKLQEALNHILIEVR